MPRTRPPYPPEFRREAIKLVRISSKSQHQIAEDLGISDVTLRNWVKQAERDEGKRPDGLSTDERDELHRLRRENQTLRVEREILKKAACFFRPGDRRAVGEMFSLIEAKKANCPVSVMCRVLGVNRTSFHNWERRAPSLRTLSDTCLTESRLSGSTPRPMAPTARGGGSPAQASAHQCQLPGVRVAPDLVERDFRPDRPNQTWSADTYVSTWEGILYLRRTAIDKMYPQYYATGRIRILLVLEAQQYPLKGQGRGPDRRGLADRLRSKPPRIGGQMKAKQSKRWRAPRWRKRVAERPAAALLVSRLARVNRPSAVAHVERIEDLKSSAVLAAELGCDRRPAMPAAPDPRLVRPTVAGLQASCSTSRSRSRTVASQSEGEQR